jgi:photosystem II stability/assembly factor-like uncharacterized protein
MKFSLTLIATVVLTFFIRPLAAQQGMAGLEAEDYGNFYKIRDAYYNIWNDVPQSERKGWKQFKRWEYFWSKRVDRKGNFPDPQLIYNAIDRTREMHSKNDRMQSTQWRQLGPELHPESQNGIRDQGIGRINCVRLHPENQKELWIGSASGGLWRTTNQGATWSEFPYTQVLSLGVSDVAISPSNPDVVYVATGDADGSTGARNFYTVGVIKTTDGGDSWEITNLNHELAERKLISRILVHPENPEIAWAATSSGVWKTTDGGDSWEMNSPTMYFIDMEMHPRNPDIIYASTFSWSGNTYVYRTTDGGESWQEIETYGGVVRIALAVTLDEPDLVYALAADNTTRGFHSLRVTHDKGNTWKVIADKGNTPNVLGWYAGTGNDTKGQGQYDLSIAASPRNSDLVVIGGINIWRSENGGRDWEMVAHWFGGFGKPYVHADIHDLNYNINGTVLYSGHDGGIDYSKNNGTSWKNVTEGLNITQFYRLSNSVQDNRVVYAGSQDNGTWRHRNGKWEHIYAGDGMECLVDYNNPNYVYVSMYNGKLYRSTNGGKNFVAMINPGKIGEPGAWITPFVIDPNNPNVLYAGYQNVWKSTDRGVSWNKASEFGISSTLEALAVAPSDSDYIYAASYGSLYYTYDGGDSWEVIATGGEDISYIAVDPKDPTKVWMSKYGYNPDEKLLMFDGSDITNLTGNLPNVSIMSVVHQKDSPDRLYVGTEIGVFYSDYKSAVWDPYGTGLPNVIANELEIHYPTNTLRVATYGRGLWETDLNTCNLPPIDVEVNGSTEICRGDSLLLEAKGDYDSFEWSNGETGRELWVTDEGTYAVSVYDPATGCTARSEAIEIETLPVPDLDISIRGNNPFCKGTSVQLKADFGFQEYLWSEGSADRSIEVDQPGEYYLTATTRDGCVVYSDTVTVEEAPLPEKPEISRHSNTLTSTPAQGYQWYHEGDKIDGANKRFHAAQQTGLFTVEITDTNGCTRKSDPYELTTSVDNSQENVYFSVHPNPGGGLFNISAYFDHPVDYQLSVTNLIGTEVYSVSGSRPAGRFRTFVDIGDQPSGVYYLTLRINGSEIYFKKLIKE